MNRIITILVTIFILLLLYIWISHVWGSDNPRRPNEIVDARENEIGDGLMADADTTLHTDITEAPAEDQPSASNDEFDTDRKVNGEAASDDTKSSEETTPSVTKKEEPKPAVTKTEEKPKAVATNNTAAKSTSGSTAAKTTEASKPAPTKTTTTKTATPKTVSAPVTSASNTNGQHLVIAGNFSQLVNAQQRASELKKAGFKDTEIINFDLSEYHTVCVGRFSDVNEARKLVKKLKDYHKIDAYVRIGG